MTAPTPAIASPPAVQRPYLDIRQEGAAPVKRALAMPPAAESSGAAAFVIGRAGGCDVPLNHPSAVDQNCWLFEEPMLAGYPLCLRE